MKKLLALLLVLGMLLGLTACGAAQPSLEVPVTQSQGSTEPLFWPPIPTGTEEPTEPTGFTMPVPTGDQEDEPVQVFPTQKPDTQQEATYYPREDEDDWERPDDSRPTDAQPGVTDDTEPVQDNRPEQTEPETVPPTTQAQTLDPNGSYDSKREVALFIVTYGRLPNNYITKSQAERLGWSGGSLERYAPGKCIGGDVFKNREGLLPKGYTYYECDIDTLGAKSRGAQRLVFTKTGIVYYTSNHYESFTRLY